MELAAFFAVVLVNLVGLSGLVLRKIKMWYLTKIVDDLTEKVVLLVSIVSLAIAFGLLVYSSWGLLYGFLVAFFVFMVGLYIFSESNLVKMIAAIFIAFVVGVVVGAVFGVFAGFIAFFAIVGILGLIIYIMSPSLEEE
jgi:ABC-type multidrug transport system permease subunit